MKDSLISESFITEFRCVRKNLSNLINIIPNASIIHEHANATNDDTTPATNVCQLAVTSQLKVNFAIT